MKSNRPKNRPAPPFRPMPRYDWRCQSCAASVSRAELSQLNLPSAVSPRTLMLCRTCMDQAMTNLLERGG